MRFVLALLILALPAQADPVRGVCTGTGIEARAEAAAIPHTLKLVFADAGGAYVADVAVQIVDTAGVVVTTARCDAPWLLVNLAPGGYTITATFQGRTVTQALTVTGPGPIEAALRF